MSQTETLKQYSQQKTEQQVSSLVDAPEMIRQVQAMRRELAQLPQVIADRTADSLEPLDKMAKALDQGLDTQRAIMDPLISKAVESIGTQMATLAHDRVQRSVRIAMDQHKKAQEARQAERAWMKEAKASRMQKAAMRAQIQTLTLRFWVATGSASTLAVVLALMILGRFL